MPLTDFLSRASAAQAASRSTRTGSRRAAPPRPRPCRDPRAAAPPAVRARPPRRGSGRGSRRPPRARGRTCGRGSGPPARRARTGRAGRPPPCTRRSAATSSSAGSSQSGSPASRPVFTTSAIPARRSLSGSVSSSAGSIAVRIGPVEGADEVLALGQVDGRLAADRRVDLADERRRHRDPADAAQVRRGREARRVGRAAAAEGDDRSVSPEPQLTPEPLDRAEALRLLASAQRVDRRLQRRAVQTEHRRVRDHLDLTLDQLGQSREQPLSRRRSPLLRGRSRPRRRATASAASA